MFISGAVAEFISPLGVRVARASVSRGTRRLWGVHERYLCPVVPLVVYHGERSWTGARSLAELVGAPSGLDEYQVDFRFPLLDLSQLTDVEIAGEPLLQQSWNDMDKVEARGENMK